MSHVLTKNSNCISFTKRRNIHVNHTQQALIQTSSMIPSMTSNSQLQSENFKDSRISVISGTIGGIPSESEAEYNNALIEEACTISRTTAIIGRIRGILLVSWTFLVISPIIFTLMLLFQPITLLFDKYRRMFPSKLNYMWSILSSYMFFRVKIEGRENLPPDTQPCIYIANHISYMDIAALLQIGRSFKFLSKESIFKLPLIGWMMNMTGHVKLKRKDKKSSVKCLQHCQMLLENGASVMFFPEGTRSEDKKLSEFKKGAFSLAYRTKCKIVPISVSGTADVMPKGMEGCLFKGKPKLIIHPTIDTHNLSIDEILNKSWNVIASGLPHEYL